MSAEQPTVVRSPIHEIHESAGARLVPFAGWLMPLDYGSVIDEHMAVRTSAGLFDVSHMGELLVRGPAARLDLQRMLSNDIDKLTSVGYAQYTLLTNDSGGIEDDLIVYRMAADEFLLVVNAANVEHDAAWLRSGASESTSVDDVSDRYAMFALQGPQALDVLADVLLDIRELPAFRFTETQISGTRMLVATTGYTGERGCELLCDVSVAQDVWTCLARDERVTQCGLGSRDTLRLEACYPLHGSDIGPTTSAVAAGLDWVCGWSTDFVGRDALRTEREHDPARSLQALVMDERGVPRRDCTLFGPPEGAEEPVGLVTSGSMSPVLGVGIGLAYVDREWASPGAELRVDIRGRMRKAHIAQKPVYRTAG